MTKKEKQIISAYTGYLVGITFQELHEYIEEKMGRPVFTHEMADENFTAKLRGLVKPDFMDICSYTDPERCRHKDGDYVKLGEHDIDPCLYKEIERHYNCNVIVSKCVRCGNIDISWTPGENYWCAEDLG